MKRLLKKFRRPGRRGFTMIEVVVALAVMSVGILAILGLLPTALQSSRDAADNTLAATIVQDAFSNLRSYPFGAAVVCDACGPGNTPLTKNLATFDTTLPGVRPVTNLYDQAGFSANWPDAYYAVMLDYQPRTPLALSRVTATVVWPAKSAAPINKNVFITNVAQYDR
jgi:prepilin-type N-terminal cleavage/methylation domain-containing protein